MKLQATDKISMKIMKMPNNLDGSTKWLNKSPMPNKISMTTKPLQHSDQNNGELLMNNNHLAFSSTMLTDKTITKRLMPNWDRTSKCCTKQRVQAMHSRSSAKGVIKGRVTTCCMDDKGRHRL